MRFRRLRTKIILSFCALMLAGGTVTTLVVRYSLSQSLMAAARERGQAVAEVMAHQLSAPIAAGDWSKAQLLVDTESDHNAFVVLEARGGRVLEGARGDKPVSIDAASVIGLREPTVLEVSDDAVLNVPASIEDGELGTVHIGVALQPVFATVDQVVREVVLTTGAAMLVGIAGIFLLAGLIARPIGRLTQAARRMGEGDLSVRAPDGGSDELGELATSFNEMAAEIFARVGRIEELRSYFERILDHLTKSVVVCSTDGTVEYANSEARARFGARPGEKSVDLLAAVGDLEQVVSGTGPKVLHRTHRSADGRTFAISIGSLRSVADSGSVVVSIADVTEMARMSDRLRRTERIAVAGEIASGIVHAINNPLDGVHRALELAQKHRGDAESVDQLLTYAQDGTKRIAQITRGLLSFAQADEPTSAASVAPATILEDALALVALRAEQSGVRVRLAVDPGTPNVTVDPRAMVEVVVNLLVNALDASPAGSEIGARAAPAAQGGVEIAVQDAGDGVPKEITSRIFEPFFTTKQAGHGTGLGLSMARRIVDAAGGEITLAPPDGGGARFSIWLPASDSER